MPNWKYNPPTRTHCSVCEALRDSDEIPIIDSKDGKASSASSHPIHNWFYFVLGYTPQFPNYIIQTEGLTANQVVLDPFMGAGTTLVACKEQAIPSIGIDANDYFFDVVKTKTTWDIDLVSLKTISAALLSSLVREFSNIDNDFGDSSELSTSLFGDGTSGWLKYLGDRRAPMLETKYISDIPLAKLLLIKDKIQTLEVSSDIRNFLELALTSIVVPMSNVKYGPGFGVTKPKRDAPVLSAFSTKLNRMIDDLAIIQKKNYTTSARVLHGDAREMDKYLASESIDQIITSPPYPGDHEYTKHTRLELIFMDYAQSINDFRTIKKRMIRGSTTNIYKEDADYRLIRDIESIRSITKLIDMRLKEDEATSGFEKLYTRLVWEYFGGMYRVFMAALKVLKPGGKFHLLVSDSHAFKMVHIETARILGEVALRAGFETSTIRLWQHKSSTSHEYDIREEILTVIKAN